MPPPPPIRGNPAFYGLFQANVLINFFIPLRWDEAITCENFIPAKQDPGSVKEGSCLARMKLYVTTRYNL